MKNRSLISTLVILVVIGFIGWYLSANGLFPGGSGGNSSAQSWQAVFLTNGQVYFGKLSSQNSNYAILHNIYYLQLAQAPQPDTSKDTSQQTQVSLVKLGNELHGPVDLMRINRDQILFIEDMKSDSKVVQAINNYVKNGSTTPAASPVASPSK